jgi:hypothetical protein
MIVNTFNIRGKIYLPGGFQKIMRLRLNIISDRLCRITSPNISVLIFLNMITVRVIISAATTEKHPGITTK